MALSPWFARYLDEGLRRCSPALVSPSCPSRWAVSCLDHFNCEHILRDVIDPMVFTLREKFDDVWTGQLSECEGDCLDRQHLVLNANLVTRFTWLPQRTILVNVEQLSEIDSESARKAANVAASSSDPLVKEAGERCLLTNSTIGVTVDDSRKFAPLDYISLVDRVWLDYSYTNIDLLWKHNICALPKGIGSTSSRPLVHETKKQVDVVQLGGIGIQRRSRIIDELRSLGHDAVLAEGAFGSDRHELLSRTKIGLNIKRHENRRIPEVARILAYLKAGATVVSEDSDDDLLLQSELRGPNVHFVPYHQLVNFTHHLLLSSPEQPMLQEREERQFLFATLEAVFPSCFRLL